MINFDDYFGGRTYLTYRKISDTEYEVFLDKYPEYQIKINYDGNEINFNVNEGFNFSEITTDKKFYKYIHQAHISILLLKCDIIDYISLEKNNG